jgi:nitroreductase
MNFAKLVEKNRSVRRFDESYQVDYQTLEYLTGLARLSASGSNKQGLKFVLLYKKEDCQRIFPFTVWAGYLKDWHGPEPGERPSAYIVILGDRDISESFGVDHGIAAQSIMLGATEKGLGGCMIGSIKRDEMRKEFSIHDRFEILLILALGRPVEKVLIEDIKDGDVKYWRDDKQVHHVPKRKLSELIISFSK